MVNGDFNLSSVLRGANKKSNDSSFSIGGKNTFTNSVWLNNAEQTPRKTGEYGLSNNYVKIKRQAEQTAQQKVKRALNKAKIEVKKGVVEKTPNDSIDIRRYRAFESANHKTPVKSTAPYCASFVSWCYGNDFSAFGYEAYTPSLRNKAKKAGFYTEKNNIGNGKNGTYRPKSGDLLMWINKNGSGGHVGMIESCRVINGKMYITTIEGNTVAKGQAETATTKAQGEGPEGVMRKTYSLDELKSNPRVNGVVRMEEWLTRTEEIRLNKK